MDSLPLIPKSNRPENHDVSNIISEVFQDVINNTLFPKNVAESTEKFNLQNENLKASGAQVVNTYNSTKLCMNDIGFVEDKLMVGQGKFLIEKDVVNNNSILTENFKLKRRDVFENLESNDVKNYGLLQKIDLLPNRAERSMDFRINSNRHMCTPPCPLNNDQLDLEPTKLEKSSTKRKLKAQRRPVIFMAEPQLLVFHDYETGIVYTQTFKLRNISKTTQAFIPRLPPKESFFKVELQMGTTRVAPGVCSVFLVKYQTDIYKDAEDIMTFNTYSGCDVIVKFKSCRRPPNLLAFLFKSFDHFSRKFTPLEQFDLFDDRRNIALNSTIDCGSCLLGNKINLNLILRNDGNTGRFFIMTEDDWYFAELASINNNMELDTLAFHIYPIYFQIESQEFIELDLTFYPMEYGLAVEKLFLLCNNNTFEELEIVGDGILFEINSITIEAEEKQQFMMDRDEQANLVINFGKMIPFQNKTRSIAVHNNTVVDLNYKWEVRESLCHIHGTQLKRMKPDWVTLTQNYKCLPGQSTLDFGLSLKCKTTDPGLYSLVYTFYVLDIPVPSLSDDTLFSLSEDITIDSETKVVNIIVDEIEMICEVTPINIIFDPENITIPNILSNNETFKQKIQIYTAGSTFLNCEWKLPTSSNTIDIFPITFILKPEIVFICNLQINVTSYDDIQGELRLLANNGLYEKAYKIHGKVHKPAAQFSQNVLNFGFIPKGRNVEGKDLFIENLGVEALNWEIFEFYFDHRHNTICELDAAKHLSLTQGKVDKNCRCRLTYNIDNSNQHHRWLSFLILLSSHPTLEAMNSLCLITYEVTQPEIIIHTSSSQQPILYPGKLLYIGITTIHTICLHNVGTNLPASFVWGKPVGQHAESIQINCTPRTGIIQPLKCMHINVSLLPLERGILDEVYVPCFVGNTDEPIMLVILCVVDNICVYFHLPNEEGKFLKVFWPPNIISDFEDFSLQLDRMETEYEEENDGTKETLWKNLTRIQTAFRNSLSQLTSKKSTFANIEEKHSEEIIKDEQTTSESYFNLEESIENMEEEKLNTFASASGSLKSCLGSDLILQDHFLEYRNVPLKCAIKKTVIIENLTPLIGDFSVEASNFCASEEKEDGINDLMVKFNVLQRDMWEESINNDHGISVKVSPNKGTFGPQESLEVDIWVYANTWGTYVEEILIEINHIAPFCFNLLIQVIGLPIEFPFALNSLSKEPVLRCGSMPYLSMFQRKLIVRNFGCIPLTLTWHGYYVLNGKEKNIKKPPFNVAIDILSSTNRLKSEDEIKLMLTAEYYGKEDYNILKIEPAALTINPKSTEMITITIDSSTFNPKFMHTDMEACLIGFVHIIQEHIFQSNMYCRKTGVEASPVKIKMLATFVLPLLKLELIKGDTRIKAYANDIIEALEMRYTVVLVFRNVDNAPATIYMHIMSPFHVVSLHTPQTNTNIDFNAAVVQPGDCVEVLIECRIDAEEVVQYSDMLFNDQTTIYPEIPDFKYNSITLLRYLNIHQHGLKQQITPLELVVFYPRITVSADLIDFGVVFIGNTKKMLLKISNNTGSNIPFSIHKPTTSNAIIITPKLGIIQKANGTTPSNVTISFYFIPKYRKPHKMGKFNLIHFNTSNFSESKVYQETIRVLTNIPFYHFNVNLIGVGSNNEKFYVEGT